MSTPKKSQIGISRANRNREVRQDELRAKLSAGRHIEDVLDIAKKLGDLRINLSQTDVVRLNMKANIKLAIIKKYMPDLKQQEIIIKTGEEAIDIAEVDRQLAKLYAIK